MALSEEAIRLVFDLSKSATDVEDLTQKIAKLGVETERAAKIAEQAWEKEARARKESNVEAMKGQQAIEATRRQLTAQEAELRALEAAWKKNTLEAGEYLAKQSELQAEISQTTNVLMRMKGTGAGGAQGQGIMAMSYAFQDFTSQVRNGFGPALASIQNNIPGMLMGTGLSNPAIAAISAISVGIGLIAPAIIKAFGPDSQEHIDKATEKIKEFTDEIETAHKAFIGMTEKPTTPEEEYAANIKAIFETRGTGDIVKTAIGKQFSGAEIEQALRGTMTEAQFAGRIGHVGMSDAEIEKMVHEKAMRVDPKTGAMTRGTLEEERGFREQLLQQQAEERVMRSKLATVAMSGAVIAGPKGERGRAILGRAMD